jgi:hypothetical protein
MARPHGQRILHLGGGGCGEVKIACNYLHSLGVRTVREGKGGSCLASSWEGLLALGLDGVGCHRGQFALAGADHVPLAGSLWERGMVLGT